MPSIVSLENMVKLLGRRIKYTAINSVDGTIRREKIGLGLIGNGNRDYVNDLANDRLDVLIPLTFFVDRYDASENQGFPMPEPGDRIDLLNDSGETRLTLVVITGDNSITYTPSDPLYTVLRVHCRVTGRDRND